MLKSQSIFLSKHLYLLYLFLFLLSCSAQNSSYTNTLGPKHVLVHEDCGDNFLADNKKYENSKFEVQHKKCGEEGNLEGFLEMREREFEGIGECITEGEGYCDMRHEGIHVLAQCGEDLAKCECGECIGNAEEILRVECKYSSSGAVYLEGCFVSYGPYGHYEDGDHGYSDRDYDEESFGTGKLVAIVVGGVALLAVVAMFLYSCRNKSDGW